MSALALRRDARLQIEPEIEWRRSPAGFQRHVPAADHRISMHAGAPVHVSCQTCRSVRTRGQIDVLPAGSSEAWFEDAPSESVELKLPHALIELAAEEMGLDSARAGVDARCHVRDSRIEHIVWALEAEHGAGDPNGLLYRQSLGLALAVHLLARYRAPQVPRARLSPQQIERVIEYVEAHLREDVSLARLAGVAGVSPSHFRVVFRRTMGVAPHEYVIQRRVERARALLATGELTASHVASEAGFSHQSHMARCMKRVLGVTPSAIARSSG